MNYHVELKPRSIKDLRRLPKKETARVLEALENLQEELADYQDLKDLRAAKSKEADAGTVSLAEVREELNL